MIKTVADYARTSGAIEGVRIDRILQTVDAAIAGGTYFAVVPQFIVTAAA